MNNIVQFKAKKSTGNYTHLFDKKEVVDFAKTNNNYLHSCSMAGYKKLTSDSKDGNMQPCWIHGWHTYAGRGKYYIINYGSLSPEKAEDLLNATKDWLTIRGYDGFEKSFQCPKELVPMVIYMLSHNFYWLKYVLKYGLSQELAFHLAFRYTITAETNYKIHQVIEKFNDEANGICYKRVPDRNFGGWSYFYNDKTHSFDPNPLYTKEQIECLLKIAQYNAQKELRAIELEHQEKIQQQNKEGK